MSSNQQQPQQFAENVSWDDDSIQPHSGSASQKKLEKFKAKGGKTHRILILDEQPVQVFQHYKKEFGYIRCLRSLNDGTQCAACDAGDRASQRFGVNVLVYPDNANVGVDVTPSNTKVMGWLFGAKTFSDLRNIKSEWGPLSDYDLKISCTNEQFQHLAITPCKDKLYSASPSVNTIGEVIADEKYDLKSKLGRTHTEVEVAGIWEGSLTRDDVFIKKGESSPVTGGSASHGNANHGVGAPSPYRPDKSDFSETVAPSKLDINSLLTAKK